MAERAPAPKRPRAECADAAESGADGGDLAATTAAHEAWTQAFAAAHGRRPVRADIDADADAAANAARMRELTIAAAAPPVAGQCQYFVWRKKRFCASRAAHTQACFCSDHEPAKLVQLQRDSIAGQQQQQQRRQQQPAPLAAPEASEEQLPSGDRSSAGPRRGRGVKTNQDRNPKRMTNPLSKQFQTPVPAPDWAAVYADSERPLLLDIGCARGRFLQELALRRPESYNYCGVEIFAPLVVAANEWAASPPAEWAADGTSGGASAALRHLHFIAANINASMESLRFPNLRLVCLQFPDPWHAKHGKRRVMSSSFAAQIAALLPAGGLFYFCSDHAAIAWHIRECIMETGCFEALSDDDLTAREASDGLMWGGTEEVIPPAAAAVATAAAAVGATAGADDMDEHLAGRGEKSKCRSGDVTPATATGGQTVGQAAAGGDGDGGGGGGEHSALPCSSEGWLKRSPFPVPTERDRVCELKWRPVWRMMLSRKKVL
jgi:tRNA (guanine-N7-)-methyltransferase